MQRIEVEVTVALEVPDDYDEHETIDALKWHLLLIDWDACPGDPSPTKVVGLTSGAALP